MATQNLTAQDVQRMRELIKLHDAQNPVSVNEFDLNNPPRKPYVHQEFPRLMYRGKQTRTANDEQEMQEAIECGWDKNPPTIEPVPDAVQLSPEVPLPTGDEPHNIARAARRK